MLSQLYMRSSSGLQASLRLGCCALRQCAIDTMAVMSPIETANSHDLTVPLTTAPRVCQTLTVLVERACNSRSTAVVLCLCILPSISYDRKSNTSHEDIGDRASWSHTATWARYIGESLIDVLNPDCPSCGTITASCSVSVESRCKSVALIRIIQCHARTFSLH